MTVDSFNRLWIRDSDFEGRNTDDGTILCVKTEHGLFMVATEDLMNQPPPRHTCPERSWEAAQRGQVASFNDEGEDEGYEDAGDQGGQWEGFK